MAATKVDKPFRHHQTKRLSSLSAAMGSFYGGIFSVIDALQIGSLAGIKQFFAGMARSYRRVEKQQIKPMLIRHMTTGGRYGGRHTI